MDTEICFILSLVAAIGIPIIWAVLMYKYYESEYYSKKRKQDLK